ncbi:rhodanese [Sphingomonas sp. AP4-R1]|nr:rhodanese [Sphingomonas sp. AP4-R1]
MTPAVGPAPAPPAAPAPRDPALFDPATGYRITAYRGVVPARPPGIARIGTAEASRRLADGRTLFIDVTPARGAVHDAETGEWRLSEPHETIPGAHWFPEAGRGTPDPAIDRWFERGLHRLSRGSRRSPIVVFCLADCWMSWNAGWKLRRLGYRTVAWYADGLDGWRETNRPLVGARPDH